MNSSIADARRRIGLAWPLDNEVWTIALLLPWEGSTCHPQTGLLEFKTGKMVASFETCLPIPAVSEFISESAPGIRSNRRKLSSTGTYLGDVPRFLSGEFLSSEARLGNQAHWTPLVALATLRV